MLCLKFVHGAIREVKWRGFLFLSKMGVLVGVDVDVDGFVVGVLSGVVVGFDVVVRFIVGVMGDVVVGFVVGIINGFMVWFVVGLVVGIVGGVVIRFVPLQAGSIPTLRKIFSEVCCQVLRLSHVGDILCASWRSGSVGTCR